MGAVMLRLFLLECWVFAISADHIDSGQYFRKISSENDVIADNAVFLNEDFFKCQKSQSCVVSRRGVEKKEEWRKVSTEPVYINLARGKVTKQSSRFRGKSKLAVDGSTLGYQGTLCSTTKNGPDAWWMVDFGAKAQVESVKISPRTDCCLLRLRDFDIRIGNTKSATANAFCRKNAKLAAERTENFKCDKPQVGRYLYIITHVKDRLTLCEVNARGFYV